MSENQLLEERKFLNIILKHLDDAGEVSPDLAMEKNFMKVSHKQKQYKITVEQNNAV